MFRTAFLAASFVSALAFSQPKTYEFDNAHTSIGFIVTHMTVSEVPGTFSKYKGAIAWDDKNPAASKIDVTVSAESVDTGTQKRDDHLRSPDFFDVAKTPDIRFVSKSVKAEGAAFTVSGDFTIHGITKPVTFSLVVTPEVENPMSKAFVRGLKSTFTVKRSDYKLGEKLPNLIVGDDVVIKVSAEVFRKP